MDCLLHTIIAAATTAINSLIVYCKVLPLSIAELLARSYKIIFC